MQRSSVHPRPPRPPQLGRYPPRHGGLRGSLVSRGQGEHRPAGESAASTMLTTAAAAPLNLRVKLCRCDARHQSKRASRSLTRAGLLDRSHPVCTARRPVKSSQQISTTPGVYSGTGVSGPCVPIVSSPSISRVPPRYHQVKCFKYSGPPVPRHSSPRLRPLPLPLSAPTAKGGDSRRPRWSRPGRLGGIPAALEQGPRRALRGRGGVHPERNRRPGGGVLAGAHQRGRANCT